MRTWLSKSWFLLALLVLLPGGMTWGWSTSEGWRVATAGRIQPAATTVAVLFLMSFSLDGHRLRESFRTPKPVLWGTLVNLGLLPLLAWPVAMSHGLADFSLGLMITATIPCTLATASVSTRQAGGNDAVSLLVTLLSNIVGVVLTPLWLKWAFSTSDGIDTGPIIRSLALTVLLPTIAGQLARLIPPLGRFAIARKFQISIVAQCLVLLIVSKTAIEAGGRLQVQSVWPTAFDFARLAIECTGLHVVAMIIAEYGGRGLGLSRLDRIATVFAGSQKTLPVGLLLAAMPAVTGGHVLPFITFPILLFHAVQLILDTAVADRMARSRETYPT
jgi:solute carrier family 10 (sodium/bile acid cotransporter), member 7